MRGIFFYTIGIGVASGILIRSLFVFGLPELTVLAVLGTSALLLWRHRASPYESPLFLTGLFVLCALIGALRFTLVDEYVPPLTSKVGERVTVEGVIVREPDVRSTSVHLYVRLLSNETVLVFADRYRYFSYGDRVRAQGVIEKPESFETDFGRTFDYPGYLKARGVRHTIPFGKVEVIGEGEGNRFVAALLHGKRVFSEAIERTLPEPESGLALGVLLGEKRALGKKLEEAFRSVGIIHIVVLSGYNIMLVAEAVMRILSWFFRPRVRLAVGVVTIFSFAVLVGLSATVIRASVMAALVLLARTIGRSYAVIRALMLAAVVMLLVNPYLLVFDPGFQLSFLATLGLIALSPFLEERLRLAPTKFQVREFLTATLATQVFILPFLVFLVGTFSVVSVVVNLLILPMVSVAMLLSFASGILSLLFEPVGIVAGFFAYLSLAYIIKIAEIFAAIPFASFGVSSFSFWYVLLAYAILGGVLSMLTKKREAFPIDDAPEEFEDTYADWTIEETKTSEGALRAPSEASSKLPFR